MINSLQVLRHIWREINRTYSALSRGKTSSALNVQVGRSGLQVKDIACGTNKFAILQSASEEVENGESLQLPSDADFVVHGASPYLYASPCEKG